MSRNTLDAFTTLLYNKIITFNLHFNFMDNKLVANACDPTICNLLKTAQNNAVGIIVLGLSLGAFIYMAKSFILWYAETNPQFRSQHLSHALKLLGFGALTAAGGLLIIFNGAGANILSFFGIK